MIRRMDYLEGRICFLERHLGLASFATMRLTRRLLFSLGGNDIAEAIERFPWPPDTDFAIFPREFNSPLDLWYMIMVTAPDIPEDALEVSPKFAWDENCGLMFSRWEIEESRG